jgi:hypothetical protein
MRFAAERQIKLESSVRPSMRRRSIGLPMLGSNVGWMLSGLLLLVIWAAERSSGQWAPPAQLRNIPVLADCHLTRHGVGVSIQPTLFYPKGAIFLCPERERAIETRHPGVSRFFLVHEYGHLAMRSRDEAIADEWAAKQLASVPAERTTLRAVLSYFVEVGTLFDPLYGSGFDRALRVARAAELPEGEWPGPLVAFATAQENGKAGGTTISLRTQGGYLNAAQMVIWIDRKPIGVLSNVDRAEALDLPKLVAGRHLIQAHDVWLYHLEPNGEKSEIARRLDAECNLDSTGKKAVSIELRFDGETLSIRANEQ